MDGQPAFNGFCASHSNTSAKNYSRMLITDFNKDSIPDIVLFGKESKNIALHKGEEEFPELSFKEKFFFYPVTEMKKLDEREDESDLYIFVSRKKRLAGLASFTKYGTLQLLNQIEFDSYPSGISTGDFNEDRVTEAIIYGDNFNGLSILTRDDLSLKETKITEGATYSFASFVDPDYDGITDLIAYNNLKGKLVFFQNDHEGGFREAREIELTENPKDIAISDLNNDGFVDLSWLSDRSFYYIKGDSVSSYRNKKELITNYKPRNYAICDFNSDRFADLLITSENNVNLYTGNKEGGFTLSLPMLFGVNPEAIAVYGHGKKSFVSVYDSGGKIFSIFKTNNITGEISLPVSGEKILKLDNKEKNSFLICGGNNKSAFEFTVSGSGSSLRKIDNFLSGCYTELKSREYSEFRREVYFGEEFDQFEIYDRVKNSDKLITGLFIQNYKARDIFLPENHEELYSVTLQEGRILFKSFPPEIENDPKMEEKVFGENVSDAQFAGTKTPVIHFWEIEGDSAVLYSINPIENDADVKSLKKIKLEAGKFPRFTGDIGNDRSLSIINDQSGLRLIIARGKKVMEHLLNPGENPDIFPEMAVNKMGKDNNIIQLFFYIPFEDTLYRAEIDFGNNKSSIRKVVDSIDINTYFYPFFYNREQYIIYTDSEEQINIRKLYEN